MVAAADLRLPGDRENKTASVRSPRWGRFFLAGPLMNGIMSGVRPRVSHTEFGRCNTPGLGQTPKGFIAALCAFNDLASDVAASLMSLAAHPEDLTCPFKGDFHIGEGAKTKSICDHGHPLSLRGQLFRAALARSVRSLTQQPNLSPRTKPFPLFESQALLWSCVYLGPGAFDDPIPTPNGKTLRTLKDAAAYIMALPKREAADRHHHGWVRRRGASG